MARTLRIYRTLPGKLDEFVKGWRELIVPARERHGFTVEHAWALREENALAWMVHLPGDEENFKRKSDAYLEDPLREPINTRIRPILVPGSVYFAEPVDIH